MDFTERLILYKESGQFSEDDEKDILNIIALFKEKYQIELKEENASFFIAHLCSAYMRLHDPNAMALEALPLEAIKEMQALDTYAESLLVLADIDSVTNNHLNDVEKAYCLLHINNLLMEIRGTNK